MWTVIVPLVASLLGYGVRYVIGERRWAQVRSVALGMLADPGKPEVTDPKAAVLEALLVVQFERLEAEARKVEQAFRLNGVHSKGGH